MTPSNTASSNSNSALKSRLWLIIAVLTAAPLSASSLEEFFRSQLRRDREYQTLQLELRALEGRRKDLLAARSPRIDFGADWDLAIRTHQPDRRAYKVWAGLALRTGAGDAGFRDLHYQREELLAGLRQRRIRLRLKNLSLLIELAFRRREAALHRRKGELLKQNLRHLEKARRLGESSAAALAEARLACLDQEAEGIEAAMALKQLSETPALMGPGGTPALQPNPDYRGSVPTRETAQWLLQSEKRQLLFLRLRNEIERVERNAPLHHLLPTAELSLQSGAAGRGDGNWRPYLALQGRLLWQGPVKAGVSLEGSLSAPKTRGHKGRINITLPVSVPVYPDANRKRALALLFLKYRLARIDKRQELRAAQDRIAYNRKLLAVSRAKQRYLQGERQRTAQAWEQGRISGQERNEIELQTATQEIEHLKIVKALFTAECRLLEISGTGPHQGMIQELLR